MQSQFFQPAFSCIKKSETHIYYVVLYLDSDIAPMPTVAYTNYSKVLKYWGFFSTTQSLQGVVCHIGQAKAKLEGYRSKHSLLREAYQL